MTTVQRFDSWSRASIPEPARPLKTSSETGADDVARRCATAVDATAQLEALGRSGRAAMLRAMADALEADRELLVETADRETALGATRLNGELTRTTFQLRFFADVIEDGAYLEATIDHAGRHRDGTAPGSAQDAPADRARSESSARRTFPSPSRFPAATRRPRSRLAARSSSRATKHTRGRRSCAPRRYSKGAAAVGVTEDVVSLVLGRDAGTAVVLDPNIAPWGSPARSAAGAHCTTSRRSGPRRSRSTASSVH